ncbi:MAG: hypothetical protein BM485_07795 [Desulfobulbaceae bacterium DB1]|nr:MAG: hypothetical protein BM485_07795 [Desulfobulbaceae bacterium DB1]
MQDLAAPVDIVEYLGHDPGSSWRLVINVLYQQQLQSAGLRTFEDFYDLHLGTLIKKIKERSVYRCEIAGTVFFLKRHDREQQQKKGLRPSSSLVWQSEGGKEFVYFYDFRRHGLATAVPVAMGERVYENGTVDSFFLTEDFSPYVQLEELIRNQPDRLAGLQHTLLRKNILRGVAGYAGKMHASGYNHLDFNATHVLLANIDSGAPDIALFDLQRIDRNTLGRFRWPVKALAEFNYSSRENAIFSDSERFLLFQVYLAKEGQSLNLLERLTWRWIRSKTERIARHADRRRARKKVG